MLAELDDYMLVTIVVLVSVHLKGVERSFINISKWNYAMCIFVCLE